MISSPIGVLPLWRETGRDCFFASPAHLAVRGFADGGAAVEAALLKAAGKVEGVIHKHLQNY